MTDDGKDRMRSPLGDRRERPVRCRGRYGCRRETWAYDAICSECHESVAVGA